MPEDNSQAVDVAPDVSEAPDAEVDQDLDMEEVEALEGQEDQSKPKSRNVRKYKVKVDNEEFEEEIDVDDEEGMVKRLQKAKAADKRMNEAARSRQQTEQFLKMLKSDPIAILSNPALGLDFRKLAEEYLARQLEDELLSPEEKRLRQADEIIKREEETKKQAKERQEREALEREEAQASENIQKTIIQAMDKVGVLRSPATVKRMAFYMRQNIERGLDLTPDELAEKVRSDYVNELRELTGSASAEELEKMLGEDVQKKLQQQRVKKLKGYNPGQTNQPPPSRETPAKGYLTMSEWREAREKK